MPNTFNVHNYESHITPQRTELQKDLYEEAKDNLRKAVDAIRLSEREHRGLIYGKNSKPVGQYASGMLLEGQHFENSGQMRPGGSQSGNPVGQWAAVEVSDKNSKEKSYYYESFEERFDNEETSQPPAGREQASGTVLKKSHEGTFQHPAKFPEQGRSEAEFYSGEIYRRSTDIPNKQESRQKGESADKIKTKAKQAAAGAKEAVNLTIDATGKKIDSIQQSSEVGSDIKDIVKDNRLDAAKANAQSAAKAAKEATEDAATAIRKKSKDVASDTVGATKKLAKGAVNAAAGAVDAAKDAISSAWDATKDKAVDVTQAAKEKASDVAEATKETGSKFAEKVNDVAEATKDKVGDMAEAVKEKVGDVARATRDKTKDLVSTTKETVNDVADAAKDTANNTLTTAKHKSNEIVDAAKDLTSGNSEVTQKIGEVFTSAKEKAAGLLDLSRTDEEPAEPSVHAVGNVNAGKKTRIVVKGKHNSSIADGEEPSEGRPLLHEETKVIHDTVKDNIDSEQKKQSAEHNSVVVPFATETDYERKREPASLPNNAKSASLNIHGELSESDKAKAGEVVDTWKAVTQEPHDDEFHTPPTQRREIFDSFQMRSRSPEELEKEATKRVDERSNDMAFLMQRKRQLEHDIKKLKTQEEQQIQLEREKLIRLAKKNQSNLDDEAEQMLKKVDMENEAQKTNAELHAGTKKEELEKSTQQLIVQYTEELQNQLSSIANQIKDKEDELEEITQLQKGLDKEFRNMKKDVDHNVKTQEKEIDEVAKKMKKSLEEEAKAKKKFIQNQVQNLRQKAAKEAKDKIERIQAEAERKKALIEEEAQKRKISLDREKKIKDEALNEQLRKKNEEIKLARQGFEEFEKQSEATRLELDEKAKQLEQELENEKQQRKQSVDEEFKERKEQVEKDLLQKQEQLAENFRQNKAALEAEVQRRQNDIKRLEQRKAEIEREIAYLREMNDIQKREQQLRDQAQQERNRLLEEAKQQKSNAEGAAYDVKLQVEEDVKQIKNNVEESTMKKKKSLEEDRKKKQTEFEKDLNDKVAEIRHIEHQKQGFNKEFQDLKRRIDQELREKERQIDEETKLMKERVEREAANKIQKIKADLHDLENDTNFKKQRIDEENRRRKSMVERDAERQKEELERQLVTEKESFEHRKVQHQDDLAQTKKRLDEVAKEAGGLKERLEVEANQLKHQIEEDERSWKKHFDAVAQQQRQQVLNDVKRRKQEVAEGIESLRELLGYRVQQRERTIEEYRLAIQQLERAIAAVRDKINRAESAKREAKLAVDAMKVSEKHLQQSDLPEEYLKAGKISIDRRRQPESTVTAEQTVLWEKLSSGDQKSPQIMQQSEFRSGTSVPEPPSHQSISGSSRTVHELNKQSELPTVALQTQEKQRPVSEAHLKNESSHLVGGNAHIRNDTSTQQGSLPRSQKRFQEIQVVTSQQKGKVGSSGIHLVSNRTDRQQQQGPEGCMLVTHITAKERPMAAKVPQSTAASGIASSRSNTAEGYPNDTASAEARRSSLGTSAPTGWSTQEFMEPATGKMQHRVRWHSENERSSYRGGPISPSNTRSYVVISKTDSHGTAQRHPSVVRFTADLLTDATSRLSNSSGSVIKNSIISKSTLV